MREVYPDSQGVGRAATRLGVAVLTGDWPRSVKPGSFPSSSDATAEPWEALLIEHLRADLEAALAGRAASESEASRASDPGRRAGAQHGPPPAEVRSLGEVRLPDRIVEVLASNALTQGRNLSLRAALAELDSRGSDIRHQLTNDSVQRLHSALRAHNTALAVIHAVRLAALAKSGSAFLSDWSTQELRADLMTELEWKEKSDQLGLEAMAQTLTRYFLGLQHMPDVLKSLPPKELTELAFTMAMILDSDPFAFHVRWVVALAGHEEAEALKRFRTRAYAEMLPLLSSVTAKAVMKAGPRSHGRIDTTSDQEALPDAAKERARLRELAGHRLAYAVRCMRAMLSRWRECVAVVDVEQLRGMPQSANAFADLATRPELEAALSEAQRLLTRITEDATGDLGVGKGGKRHADAGSSAAAGDESPELHSSCSDDALQIAEELSQLAEALERCAEREGDAGAAAFLSIHDGLSRECVDTTTAETANQVWHAAENLKHRWGQHASAWSHVSAFIKQTSEALRLCSGRMDNIEGPEERAQPDSADEDPFVDRIEEFRRLLGDTRKLGLTLNAEAHEMVQLCRDLPQACMTAVTELAIEERLDEARRCAVACCRALIPAPGESTAQHQRGRGGRAREAMRSALHSDSGDRQPAERQEDPGRTHELTEDLVTIGSLISDKRDAAAEIESVLSKVDTHTRPEERKAARLLKSFRQLDLCLRSNQDLTSFCRKIADVNPDTGEADSALDVMISVGPKAIAVGQLLEDLKLTRRSPRLRVRRAKKPADSITDAASLCRSLGEHSSAVETATRARRRVQMNALEVLADAEALYPQGVAVELSALLNQKQKRAPSETVSNLEEPTLRTDHSEAAVLTGAVRLLADNSPVPSWRQRIGYWLLGRTQGGRRATHPGGTPQSDELVHELASRAEYISTKSYGRGVRGRCDVSHGEVDRCLTELLNQHPLCMLLATTIVEGSCKSVVPRVIRNPATTAALEALGLPLYVPVREPGSEPGYAKRETN